MRSLFNDIANDLGYEKLNKSTIMWVIYKLFHPLFYNIKPIFLYRLSNLLWRKEFKKTALYIQFYNMKKFNCYISCTANIGGGLKLPHPLGIVIGQGVKIGSNSTIYQNVTIGLKQNSDNKYAVIKDGVIIYASSSIIGSLTIGENSIIGINSVVLTDVDSHSVYAGTPAKKVKSLLREERKDE